VSAFDDLFAGAEVISQYTAEQAVEDGMLVLVPGSVSRRVSNGVYGNDLCFGAAVLVTSHLWDSYIYDDADTDTLNLANVEALLRSAFQSFKDGDPLDLMRTDIRIASTDGEEVVTVWGVIDGAGLTLMLPEDY
jgi:hypothetical protein